MELDSEAWERWKAYRTVIKKPMKPITEEAAKLKFQRYGADQAAVVDQSIANGWQGLFELQKAKTDPNAPKKRTREESDAAAKQLEYLDRASGKDWDKAAQTVTGKLLLADALLARYDVEPDQGSAILAGKREWLKIRVGELLREAMPSAVLADFTLRRLVLRLYSDAGLRRLEARVQQRAAA
jgi:hypothetical protein